MNPDVALCKYLNVKHLWQAQTAWGTVGTAFAKSTPVDHPKSGSLEEKEASLLNCRW